MSGFPGYDGELEAQIQPFLDRLTEAGAGSDDFLDLAIDFESRVVVLYWHGTPPDVVNEVTADLAEAGFTLQVKDPSYSLEESYELTGNLMAALNAAGLHARTVTTDMANGGFVVGGPEISVDPEVQARVREVAETVVGDAPISFMRDMGTLQN